MATHKIIASRGVNCITTGQLGQLGQLGQQGGQNVFISLFRYRFGLSGCFGLVRFWLWFWFRFGFVSFAKFVIRMKLIKRRVE